MTNNHHKDVTFQTMDGIILDASETMVHLAIRSPRLCRTRCGVEFLGGILCDDSESVSCMTCLTRADVFEAPLSYFIVNHYDECCWLKRVFNSSYDCGYVTECCHSEEPCNYHRDIGASRDTV